MGYMGFNVSVHCNCDNDNKPMQPISCDKQITVAIVPCEWAFKNIHLLRISNKGFVSSLNSTSLFFINYKKKQQKNPKTIRNILLLDRIFVSSINQCAVSYKPKFCCNK